MGNELSPCVSSAEVIENLDSIAQLQQPGDQVGSNEACSTSDQCCPMARLCSHRSSEVAAAA